MKPNSTLRKELEGFYHRANTHGMNDEYQPEKVIDGLCSLIERKQLEARHDELNRITKAEDYVWTASNEDHPLEFNLESYCDNRHEELIESLMESL